MSSSSGDAPGGGVPGSAVPINDPHDQETCPPFPTGESQFLGQLPTDENEIPDSQTDGTEIPEAPGAAVQDAHSGPDLLRRLSSVGDLAVPQPSFTHPDDHPDLGLTGRVISAAFCIPYKLGFQSGESWVCVL